MLDSPVAASRVTRSVTAPKDLPEIFAKILPANSTISDNTPLPTNLHLDPDCSDLDFSSPRKLSCVPHSSSTAQINASPRSHLFTDLDGL